MAPFIAQNRADLLATTSVGISIATSSESQVCIQTKMMCVAVASCGCSQDDKSGLEMPRACHQRCGLHTFDGMVLVTSQAVHVLVTMLTHL